MTDRVFSLLIPCNSVFVRGKCISFCLFASLFRVNPGQMLLFGLFSVAVASLYLPSLTLPALISLLIPCKFVANASLD
jgi:hypothetical protein